MFEWNVFVWAASLPALCWSVNRLQFPQSGWSSKCCHQTQRCLQSRKYKLFWKILKMPIMFQSVFDDNSVFVLTQRDNGWLNQLFHVIRISMLQWSLWYWTLNLLYFSCDCENLAVVCNGDFLNESIQDHNMGLVKQCITSVYKKSIQCLTKVLIFIFYILYYI